MLIPGDTTTDAPAIQVVSSPINLIGFLRILSNVEPDEEVVATRTRDKMTKKGRSMHGLQLLCARECATHRTARMKCHWRAFFELSELSAESLRQVARTRKSPMEPCGKTPTTASTMTCLFTYRLMLFSSHRTQSSYNTVAPLQPARA